jgi:serine/threonine protein kinase
LIVTYDGVVKLIDFGVSKASRKTSHSKSGVVKGKFSYMSPEQATDGDIDHRSDIFALGVIFWELLTGRRLFQSESEFAIMEMISECKIEKPSKYNHTIPPAVERICMKALEKDVSKRYQWGSEMIMDLLDFINSCKTPFTQWHLQSWMCKVFADELDAEWKKIPIFKGINTEKDIEKYNKEHALTVAEGASVGEARTEDSSALSDEIYALTARVTFALASRHFENTQYLEALNFAKDAGDAAAKGMFASNELKSKALLLLSDAATKLARPD